VTGRPPPEKRDQKVMLALTSQERHALDAAANRLGTKRSTLAARLVRLGVMGAAASEPLPGSTTSLATGPQRTAGSAPVGEADGGQIAWLERGRGRAWRRWAWTAGEELRRRYPELSRNNRLPAAWYADDFTRDGLLALALWRLELDEGHHHDPRMELAWLRALREFTASLEQRAPLIGEAPAAPRTHPDEWIETGSPKARRLPIG